MQNTREMLVSQIEFVHSQSHGELTQQQILKRLENSPAMHLAQSYFNEENVKLGSLNKHL